MEINSYVAEILKDLKNRGMEAVKDYSKKFDDYGGEIRVAKEEFAKVESIPEEDKNIIKRVIKRVESVHKKQIKRDQLNKEDGFTYGLVYRPIERVGLYVPGGKPLPSSLIMMGVPAKLAGVKEIVVASPSPKGAMDAYTLFIAKELGIEGVYKVGGVQAIGAMAYGIGMKKVDKIFGPGNKFVTEAKRQVYGTVGIDCLAGPSEVCVIADDSANPKYVLFDLLSQVEHGGDSKAWLLSTSKELCDYCSKPEIEVYHEESLDRCLERANDIAPEHLQIITDKPMKLIPKITNAGAVYIGEYTPAAACDYFVGVNHVLPTGKSARFSSVLTVDDFMKRISLAKMDKNDMLEDLDLGIRMAEIEDLDYHRKSMEVRK